MYGIAEEGQFARERSTRRRPAKIRCASCVSARACASSFRVSYADVKHRVTSCRVVPRRVAVNGGEGEARERRNEDSRASAHLPEVSAAPRQLD